MDNIESTEVVENISTEEVESTSKQESKEAVVESKFDKLAKIADDKPLKKTEEKTSKKVEEKVEKSKDIAVFSTGNLYKHGLGEISKGYTILSPEKAKAWIEAVPYKVREATPQEVAKQYLGE